MNCARLDVPIRILFLSQYIHHEYSKQDYEDERHPYRGKNPPPRPDDDFEQLERYERHKQDEGDRSPKIILHDFLFLIGLISLT